MAKRTGAQIRKAAVEEVRVKDMLKEKVRKQKEPGASYRNPKPRLVEVICCLDKKRPLPEVFRQCPDCPKLTEVGSSPEVVAQMTEAESKPRRGAKRTKAVNKPRRGKN